MKIHLLWLACGHRGRDVGFVLQEEHRQSASSCYSKILVNDEPAVDAFVLSIPVNEPAEPTEQRQHAYVDSSGAFRLTTHGENVGAPAGD